ncbi:MAG: hypothetical protein DWQ37_06465 [Planctomycetota bacterium]|nr:MAG: hypothetical protein DWQ37_06465 [Planctomycetota bacterium]
MEAAGIEPLASYAGNAPMSPRGGAQSGAVVAPAATDADDAAQVDPGLVVVIQAWPKLPEAARLRILAIVRTAHQ